MHEEHCGVRRWVLISEGGRRRRGRRWGSKGGYVRSGIGRWVLISKERRRGRRWRGSKGGIIEVHHYANEDVGEGEDEEEEVITTQLLSCLNVSSSCIYLFCLSLPVTF